LKEIWKIIEEFPDYMVSDQGRVKSFKRYKDGKILKYRKNNKNHFQVSLCENGKCKNKLIHILVYETFNDYKLKNNECVHHDDDNPENNNINNLKLMTKTSHKSFHNIGKRNINAKLTDKDVIEILNEKKLPLSKIAEKFGIHKNTVSRIKRRETWKHIC